LNNPENDFEWRGDKDMSYEDEDDIEIIKNINDLLDSGTSFLLIFIDIYSSSNLHTE
jgi:hypothetical protein